MAALRTQTLRSRIRLVVVATATLSAVLVSAVVYVVVGTIRNEGSPAGADGSLAPLGVVLIAATLFIAVASSVASRWITGSVVRSITKVSLAARQIADRVDPGEHGPPDSDEIESLASSFDRMASGLQQRILRERRFVANVSHELRTPLTALKAAADVLAQRLEELPPAAAEAADLVVDRSRHLVRLVVELMELTELDSGSAPIRWESVDLRALLVTLMARRGLDAPVNGPAVVTYADKARLDRILGNLVDNAYEHADGRGVEVSIGTEAQEITVTVADRGPGISSEDVPHLFESFFKSGRSRARGRGGIGMGLPIAYENARLLGATIRVDSEVGRGTTFGLHLPIRDSPPQTEATPVTEP
jgi:two-component system sensor histidine kinase MtrB